MGSQTEQEEYIYERRKDNMREDGEGIRRAGAVLVGEGGMTGVPVAGGSSVSTCQTEGEQSQLFLCSKPISACTQLTLGLYCTVESIRWKICIIIVFLH
jgi:hypothetical protein